MGQDAEGGANEVGGGANDGLRRDPEGVTVGAASRREARSRRVNTIGMVNSGLSPPRKGE